MEPCCSVGAFKSGPEEKMPHAKANRHMQKDWTKCCMKTSCAEENLRSFRRPVWWLMHMGCAVLWCRVWASNLGVTSAGKDLAGTTVAAKRIQREQPHCKWNGSSGNNRSREAIYAQYNTACIICRRSCKALNQSNPQRHSIKTLYLTTGYYIRSIKGIFTYFRKGFFNIVQIRAVWLLEL